MTHHHLSHRDYEGYGIYEYDGVGLGQVPDLGTLQDYEMVRGLAHVPRAGKPFAKQLLEQMVFSRTPMPELGGVTGTASFVLGSPGSAWVSDLVASGYVVMVERASVPSGTLRIVASSVPATIVLLAGQERPAYVIVDADPSALAAAEAYRSGVVPPSLPPIEPPPGMPSGTPPVGATHRAPCDSHEVDRDGWCFPIPGGVDPAPPEPGPGPGPTAPPAGTSKYGWILPVAIGTAAVALVAVVVARRGAPAPSAQPRASVTVRSATANRRRARR